MAFPTASIRLAAAKVIFSDVEFNEIKVGEEVAGYSAKFQGKEYSSKSLTKLCSQLWTAKDC